MMQAQVLDANNTVSSKNQEISTLQKQIDDLTSQITEVKDSAEGSENKISTYDQLFSMHMHPIRMEILRQRQCAWQCQ